MVDENLTSALMARSLAEDRKICHCPIASVPRAPLSSYVELAFINFQIIEIQKDMRTEPEYSQDQLVGNTSEANEQSADVLELLWDRMTIGFC